MEPQESGESEYESFEYEQEDLTAEDLHSDNSKPAVKVQPVEKQPDTKGSTKSKFADSDEIQFGDAKNVLGSQRTIPAEPALAAKKLTSKANQIANK